MAGGLDTTAGTGGIPMTRFPGKTRHFCIRMQASQRDKLDHAAARLGVTRSNVMALLVEQYLDAARPGDLPPASAATPPSVVDVRALRAAVALTQRAFAARLGVSISIVKRWEAHTREPRGPRARRLVALAHATMGAATRRAVK